MNFLLHGDNEAAIRQKRDELKESFAIDQVWEFFGPNVSVEQLTQALCSQSLFGQKKQLVIVENLLLNKALVQSLPTPGEETSLILIESKKLSPTQISAVSKVFPDLQVREFKIDAAIFRFVESLGDRGDTASSIFKGSLSQEAPEIVFAMIVRQFRFLLLLKSGSHDGPDDWKRLSPWQKQRLETQINHFSWEELQIIYSRLLGLDAQIKLGQFPGTMREAIQFFLLGL